MNEKVSTTFERHAQTALVMLLVLLLAWVGKTTQDTSLAIAQMKVKVDYLQEQARKPHNHNELVNEVAAIRNEITRHIAECERARGIKK